MEINRNQDSKEQLAHERENEKKAGKNNHQDTEPTIDKRLDGPNRPST